MPQRIANRGFAHTKALIVSLGGPQRLYLGLFTRCCSLPRLLQGAKYFGVETEDRYTCQMFDQHDLGAE